MSEGLYLYRKCENEQQAGTEKEPDKYKLEQCHSFLVSGILAGLLLLMTAAMMLLLASVIPCVLGLVVRQSSGAPTVNVKNGTYTGIHNPTYNEDFFLGIPFAQAPIGDLRLQLPQALTETWSEPRAATEYYPECVGYGVGTSSFSRVPQAHIT